LKVTTETPPPTPMEQNPTIQEIVEFQPPPQHPNGDNTTEGGGADNGDMEVTPSKKSKGGEDKGEQDMWILGGVLGVVVGAPLIILCCCWLCSKKRKKLMPKAGKLGSYLSSSLDAPAKSSAFNSRTSSWTGPK